MTVAASPGHELAIWHMFQLTLQKGLNTGFILGSTLLYQNCWKEIFLYFRYMNCTDGMSASLCPVQLTVTMCMLQTTENFELQIVTTTVFYYYHLPRFGYQKQAMSSQ